MSFSLTAAEFEWQKIDGTAKSGVGDADDAALTLLPYAHGAEFNAYTRPGGANTADDDDGYAPPHDALCHAVTCVALLAQIMAWTEAAATPNDDAVRKHVFWLSSLAGTGKLTVAHAVARCCADAQRLGGSFFFAHGGGDRASARKFVTTLTVQLAAAVPALKPHVAAAVRAAAARDLAAMALRHQWARLALEPLAKIGDGADGDGVGGGGWGNDSEGRAQLCPRRPIVFAVDALDECDSESETGAVLGLFCARRVKGLIVAAGAFDEPT
jgi:hypothetical protein